ncbi:hypothetical protein CO657_11090 [Rhizobium acidisoli]|uniref:Uncharacterized protein n=1 Tax=Rhizobium acidisoli TaxID=1538158 RepID=A0AAE5TVZ4_9HYPH|nr:hypothetical protein [Rhizobium acidisoli]KPH05044.1 hypothetical protein AOG23_30120 [Rhizobium acidisoli]QAS78580.1 hypothetical protein CO657_11090 [Rhizobium acidisoli]
MRRILVVLIVFDSWSSAAGACTWSDIFCDVGKAIEKSVQDAGKAIEKGMQDTGKTVEKSAHDTGSTVEKAGQDTGILHPVREYVREIDIPPDGVGAYGIVALKSKQTSANSAKLMMVCRSFLAHFDRSELSPYPVSDQMITIWPLDDPEAKLAKADDCDWVLQHYVLGAASTAMAYAVKQNMAFDGEGPFLIGWSPADSRGKPDKLVLVVDMSTSNDQASIDHDFDFWKDKIVKDPKSWRSGFSVEAIRQKLKDFVDQYGDKIVKDIKMVGL